MYATAHIQATLAAPTAPIVIPRTAILWTGPRSIVYVKLPTETPSFQMREIELGPSLGDAYVVLSGLSEGEQIITRGAFAVDASAQLEGKPSMMNPRPTLTDQTLVVHGACGMCQTRIETTALTLAGVAQASWNPDTQTLHLQINTAQTKLTAVSQALAAAGHDTEMHKADQATYDNLPGCCHYRE
jgi:Cu(I)/Ag(I) efflux system membrane fusion protein